MSAQSQESQQTLCFAAEKVSDKLSLLAEYTELVQDQCCALPGLAAHLVSLNTELLESLQKDKAMVERRLENTANKPNKFPNIPNNLEELWRDTEKRLLDIIETQKEHISLLKAELAEKESAALAQGENYVLQ
jgi:hypothetical protein